MTLEAMKKALELGLVILASVAEKARNGQSTVSPIQVASEGNFTRVAANDRLYAAAYACLNIRLAYLAPPERGCAEVMSRIIRRIYPDFPVYVSTIDLNAALARSPHFKRVEKPSLGTVCIFPTVGKNTGHCGDWGKNYVINNNSYTGLVDASYTHEQWMAEVKRRGLEQFFYDAV